MGTRHEDQPAEHWAGPESLDPTPVWKQYVLVAVLLLVGLVVVVIVAVAAALPQLVTPPALVPGDRLVLNINDLPRVGATRVAAPVLDEAHAVWVVRTPAPSFIYAFPTTWVPRPGAAPCTVKIDDRFASPTGPGFVAECGITQRYHFTSSGDAAAGVQGKETRDLDRYLVSVSGDRVIVNLSRVIEASTRTSAPVPTGIPQPQGTP